LQNNIHIIPNLFNIKNNVKLTMKLTQQDMARILDIDARTLRNWRKNKPKLYDIVMKGFAVDKAIDEAKKSYENIRDILEKEK